ncbi:membrane protein [Helicobacter pylori]|nr:membrane protein [Helicobacter pylori]
MFFSLAFYLILLLTHCFVCLVFDCFWDLGVLWFLTF